MTAIAHCNWQVELELGIFSFSLACFTGLFGGLHSSTAELRTGTLVGWLGCERAGIGLGWALVAGVVAYVLSITSGGFVYLRVASRQY